MSSTKFLGFFFCVCCFFRGGGELTGIRTKQMSCHVTCVLIRGTPTWKRGVGVSTGVPKGLMLSLPRGA